MVAINKYVLDMKYGCTVTPVYAHSTTTCNSMNTADSAMVLIDEQPGNLYIEQYLPKNSIVNGEASICAH